MSILAYLLARLAEPSSYAGLGAVLALVGWNLPDPVFSQVVQFSAAGAGLIALLLKERGMLPALLLACAVVPALTGCAAAPAIVAGLGSVGSAYMLVDKATEAATPYIAEGCAAYGKAKAAADATLAAATTSPSVAAKLKSIESFGDAACASPPPAARSRPRSGSAASPARLPLSPAPRNNPVSATAILRLTSSGAARLLARPAAGCATLLLQSRGRRNGR
jgi:hypothetical protein